MSRCSALDPGEGGGGDGSGKALLLVCVWMLTELTENPHPSFFSQDVSGLKVASLQSMPIKIG